MGDKRARLEVYFRGPNSHRIIQKLVDLAMLSEDDNNYISSSITSVYQDAEKTKIEDDKNKSPKK